MIKGTGIDLFGSARFAAAKYKYDLARQVLTDKETIRYRRAGKKEKIKYFSGVFAAKEALLKAFGCGLGNFSRWHNIDISGTTVECSGPLSRQDPLKARTSIHLASASTTKYTIAIAVLE